MLPPSGQQPAHVGVPGPGPGRDPPGPRRRWCGRRDRFGLRAGRGSRRRDRCRQVLPVPGDGAFHGVAEVVPQVPLVGDLNGQRCAAGRAVGIAAGAVAADDLRTGAGSQPGGERIGGPVGQHIDRAARLDIDQQGAVTVPAAQREVIHPQHDRGAHHRWLGQRTDEPDQRHPAHRGG